MPKNTPTKTKEFKWNPKRLKAAKMLAESTQTQEKIAEEVGGGGFLKFKPVTRKCLYCKGLIYIIKPVTEIRCGKCGELHRVVMERNVKLSRVVGGKQ